MNNLNNKYLGRDTGMFPRKPDLRFTEDKALTLITPPYTFIEQTALVELVNNLSMDEGLAPAFAPFPIDRSAFERADTMTESYELEDGTFMQFYTLLSAYRAGALPEASSDKDVANMQVSVKPRLVTQWWLVGNSWWSDRIQEHELPVLEASGGGSRWVASFDDEKKESFWDTSIGKCLLFIEGVSACRKRNTKN